MPVLPVLADLASVDRELIELSALLRERLGAFRVAAEGAHRAEIAAWKGELSPADLAAPHAAVREAALLMVDAFDGAPATHAQVCLDEIAAHLRWRPDEEVSGGD